MIHPSALVSKKAALGEGVSIGPYSIIGDSVAIDTNTKIGSHCVLEGNTTIGSDCEVFTGAVIGSRPQDLKYKNEKVFLEIGNRNIIREYCTFNPGTEATGKTIVGDDNLFMAYAHIAHDCRVGNHCVIANNGTLAGHVSVEDRAVIGGLVAIHQFVRVGTLSIIGGCSKVVQDIPPYSTCDGHPAVIYGLNLIGLKRQGASKQAIKHLDTAFRILFHSRLIPKHALEKIAQEVAQCAEVAILLSFVKNSQRGLARTCRTK